MLDANLKQQLQAYLAKITQPIELVMALDDSPKARELKSLLTDIAALSDKVALVPDGRDARRPSFLIRRVGTDIGVRFAGIPMGHEFTSLVLALLQVGGHPSRASQELIAQIRALEGDYVFETYFSQSCQNCPDVVQALNLMAVLNPRIRHTAIDGALFQSEVVQRQVMAVPGIFLNGEHFGSGRMELEQIVNRLDANAAARTAEQLRSKDPFDVLIVGGGPAGTAAALYAARKGIRTGIAVERLGGQLLDTMGIENLISVPHTEGPKLAAEMESNVRAHDVDIMTMQRATGLVPADKPGGLHEIRLENGASLFARTLVIATGARWRQLGIPGEDLYRNRGVAYCPHCDGPLYRGKRTAVVGGGNSGVEAAIDLAGLVAHVTLIEYEAQLKADDVLQRKLRSLPNVTIITSAQCAEVLGDGEKVGGLRYVDRVDGRTHDLPLEGIFVQIGLVPNSEWLGDSLERTRHGEIVVDEHCRTSVPGVFAAGDVTTVPYKQIVIAMGEGSSASLSAFDHLIRMAPAEQDSMAA